MKIITRDSAGRMLGVFFRSPLHGVELKRRRLALFAESMCIGYVSDWVYRASAFAKAWHGWDGREEPQ